MIELVFDLKNGVIRTRAAARYSQPEVRMGVQFVRMQPSDRGRSNQFFSICGHGICLNHQVVKNSVFVDMNYMAGFSPVIRRPGISSGEVCEDVSGRKETQK